MAGEITGDFDLAKLFGAASTGSRHNFFLIGIVIVRVK
jgi:hypothetical protein